MTTKQKFAHELVMTSQKKKRELARLVPQVHHVNAGINGEGAAEAELSHVDATYSVAEAATNAKGIVIEEV